MLPSPLRGNGGAIQVTNLLFCCTGLMTGLIGLFRAGRSAKVETLFFRKKFLRDYVWQLTAHDEEKQGIPPEILQMFLHRRNGVLPITRFSEGETLVLKKQ